MYDKLRTRFPDNSAAQLTALASVWSHERDLIIARMFAICDQEGFVQVPVAARHEAVFELARLTLRLEDQIISKRTTETPIEELDPVAEGRALGTADRLERIENTARIYATAIWKRLHDGWWKKYPALSTVPKRGPRPLAEITSGGTKHQHFSPVFSNKRWADEATGKVRVYSIDVAGGVTSKDVGYRSWGRESFIYSQDLERFFAVVEGDARTPYMKLLNGHPFSEEDRRHWVAFLATQMYRTPWFIVQNLAVLKEFIGVRQLAYPTDTASVRRIYEGLFTDNRVFAAVYKLIGGRNWTILRAASGCQFVRSDNPAIVTADADQGRVVLYSLSPSACFAAGPQLLSETPQIVAAHRQLDETETIAVNHKMALTARRTVIARPSVDDAVLRGCLKESLGRRWIEVMKTNPFLSQYWGDLA